MRFKYLRDPVFLTCVAAYFLNRLVLRPNLEWAFLHSYLNDFICIPFWVPIMLFGMRTSRLRNDDAPPRSYEILVPLILWSVIFECWLPGVGPFIGVTVADHLDILCYAAGALAAALIWEHLYKAQSAPLDS